MSQYVIWLDHHYAYIYKFSLNEIDEITLKAHAHEESKKFFHEIAQRLSDAHELLIVGPGTAKNEFQHHCQQHHHDKLAQAIKGVVTMPSHPTKAMVTEQAREFFSRLHAWTPNY